MNRHVWISLPTSFTFSPPACLQCDAPPKEQLKETKRGHICVVTSGVESSNTLLVRCGMRASHCSSLEEFQFGIMAAPSPADNIVSTVY